MTQNGLIQVVRRLYSLGDATPLRALLRGFLSIANRWINSSKINCFWMSSGLGCRCRNIGNCIIGSVECRSQCRCRRCQCRRCQCQCRRCLCRCRRCQCRCRRCGAEDANAEDAVQKMPMQKMPISVQKMPMPKMPMGGFKVKMFRNRKGIIVAVPGYYNEFLFWWEANVIRRYPSNPFPQGKILDATS